LGFSQEEIINQPRRPNPHRHQKQNAAVNLIKFGQRLGIGGGDVIVCRLERT